MVLSQNPILKTWGEDNLANVSTFTQVQIGDGITYQANVASNQLNGVSYIMWQAIQFLQHSGGLYNATIPYINPSMVGLVTLNNGIYGVSYYVRTTANAGTTTNNPPLTGATINTVDGIDVYTGGSANTDWHNLEYDTYNFYVKYPYTDASGTIQEQMINAPGTIVQIDAILGTDATGQAFILNVLNNGSVVKKSADTYTFADVTDTITNKIDADTAVATTIYKRLALQVVQVGSTIVGQDLLVRVFVRRN